MDPVERIPKNLFTARLQINSKFATVCHRLQYSFVRLKEKSAGEFNGRKRVYDATGDENQREGDKPTVTSPSIHRPRGEVASEVMQSQS